MSLTPSGRAIPPKERKIALLGSRSVGKSSLVVRFVDSHFVESYYPTIENTFNKKVRIRGTDFSLDIHDTAGQDEFSILNSKQAVGLHGWILVYSVTSRSSFEMIAIIRDKILNYTGVDSVPLVIVGNKSDLDAQRQIKTEEGQSLAAEWKCAFTEASARENDNVAQIFELMVGEVEKAMNPPPEKGEGCTIS